MEAKNELSDLAITNNSLDIYRNGENVVSMETTEETFMRENFENASYWDSALPVQNEIEAEMKLPVVAKELSNNGEGFQKDMPENKAVEKALSQDKKNKLIMVGMGVAILYLLFRK